MHTLAKAASPASTWLIDSDRSSVEFSVAYLKWKRVAGRFRRFSGTIRVDPANLEDGWAEVTLDPASVETDQPKRDSVLREQGFLEVHKFGNCSFRARRLEPLDDGRYRLLGDLTLHGVKREVELSVRVTPLSAAPDSRRLRFVAEGRIDRKIFGVDWNPLFDFVPFFIGHLVELKISVESVEQAS